MNTLLTNEILDEMRKIGDPVVDSAVVGLGHDGIEKLAKDARKKGVAKLAEEKPLKEIVDKLKLNDLLDPPAVPGSGDALPDPGLIKVASDLFARYGSEIGAALLLAALPEGYAAGEGAKVLFARSELSSGSAVSSRRIELTTQFVICVFTPPPPPELPPAPAHRFTTADFESMKRLWNKPDGQALCFSLALRIMHSLIRNGDPKRDVSATTSPESFSVAGSTALNQEDLLATLLTFSVTVFEVLERFGVRWNEEMQEAYFYVWDWVGKTLGIGDEYVIAQLGENPKPPAKRKPPAKPDLLSLRRTLRELDEGVKPANKYNPVLDDECSRRVMHGVLNRGTLRPSSVAEARALLARLRERMWVLKLDQPPKSGNYSYENFEEILYDVLPGRVLLRALLDEATKRLPGRQKSWPIEVMRELVPEAVQNRLALGATGSLGLLSTSLAEMQMPSGFNTAKRISAEILRQRATLIADTLFLGYLAENKLFVPGLAAPVLGYGVKR